MENNLTGKGNFWDKWKSRTVIMIFGVLFLVVGKYVALPAEQFANNLMGLAAVIGACGGLHILNKREESLIQVRQGEYEFTKDTRKSGDTLVSGITGNVTKI